MQSKCQVAVGRLPTPSFPSNTLLSPQRRELQTRKSAVSFRFPKKRRCQGQVTQRSLVWPQLVISLGSTVSTTQINKALTGPVIACILPLCKRGRFWGCTGQSYAGSYCHFSSTLACTSDCTGTNVRIPVAERASWLSTAVCHTQMSLANGLARTVRMSQAFKMRSSAH